MPSVTIDRTPFYAYAGAVDLAVEKVREQATALPTVAATLPTQARELVSNLPTVEQLRERVTVPSLEELRARVQFPDVEQLRALPVEVQTTVFARVTELTEEIKSLRERATSVYGELAQRGEKVVAGLRGEAAAEETKVAETVKAEAKNVSTAAKKAPAKAKAVAEDAPTLDVPAQTESA